MGLCPGGRREQVMLIVGIVVAAIFGFWMLVVRRSRTRHVAVARRMGTTVIAFALVSAVLFMFASTGDAADVAGVPLRTAANYSVLGASTVTNTGSSVLSGSLGLWPGTSITGFPPGLVLPPGTTDAANAAAQQAQSDLTGAYLNAAGRSIDATTTAELGGLTLTPGVYAGPGQSPLSLTGTLTLDAEGNVDAVFIFQTDSTLITGSGSRVSLINGAQGCHIYWQVGSSATLGSGSLLVGNILALTSITVNSGATVQGRALARNGAVTLDDNTITWPTCEQAPPTTTTAATTTTVPGATTTTTVPGATTTTTVPGATTTTTAPLTSLPYTP